MPLASSVLYTNITPFKTKFTLTIRLVNCSHAQFVLLKFVSWFYKGKREMRKAINNKELKVLVTHIK